MCVTQWSKVGSVLLLLGATASGAGLLAQKGTLFAVQEPPATGQLARTDDVPATTVKAGKLSVTVTERGSLEASRVSDAYSLIEGQTTIIQLLPEGSAVKKGQVVCQLDSAALKDQLVNQWITVRSAEANYQNAKLAREVAEIAVTEYIEKIYKSELVALKDAVTAAQSAIQKAGTRLERTRIARKRVQDALAKKAAEKTPTDIVAELDIEDRLESAELTLLRETMALDQAKNRLDLLQNITLGRTTRELKDDVERKRGVELAKHASWELERGKARKLERQIQACTLKAPIDGKIVLANDPSRLPGRPPQIEEGATVRERQKIFSVIDLTGPMLVNAKVHESQIHRLSGNTRAKIVVDAFPDKTFDGVIVESHHCPTRLTSAARASRFLRPRSRSINVYQVLSRA